MKHPREAPCDAADRSQTRRPDRQERSLISCRRCVDFRIVGKPNRVLDMQETAMTKVRQAGIGDLDALVPLFDAYRQFYKRDTDPPAAREFLFKRFQHQQSVIFIAHDDDGAAIGFTQLYPLFSSLTLVRTFVLYRGLRSRGRRGRAGAVHRHGQRGRATPLRVRGVGARHRLLRLRARALAGPTLGPTLGARELPVGVVSILITPERLPGIDHLVTARPWPRPDRSSP